MQRVNLDPFVAISIVEQYMRSAEIEGRIEGFLLGRHVKNVTEVRSFVPSFQEDFLRLTMRSNPQDRAVGWFTNELNPSQDKVIQEKIDKNVDRPVFLLVDIPCDFKPELKFRAFVKNSITFTDGAEVSCLKEIPCTIATSDADTTVAIDAMVGVMFPEAAEAADPTRVPATTDGGDMHAHLRKVKEMLLTAKAYVDDVAAGKIEGDKALGRKLSALLTATEAKQRAATASGVIDAKMDDALMLQYLGRLLEKQVKSIQDSYGQQKEKKTEPIKTN